MFTNEQLTELLFIRINLGNLSQAQSDNIVSVLLDLLPH